VAKKTRKMTNEKRKMKKPVIASERKRVKQSLTYSPINYSTFIIRCYFSAAAPRCPTKKPYWTKAHREDGYSLFHEINLAAIQGSNP
jgi:hypothetical protein